MKQTHVHRAGGRKKPGRQTAKRDMSGVLSGRVDWIRVLNKQYDAYNVLHV